MSMLLSEARTTLTDSGLHIGSTSLSDAKKDRAIREAVHKYQWITRCTVETQTFNLAANDTTVNIAGTLTHFEEDLFVDAYIGFQPVEKVSYPTLTRRYQHANVALGTPTHIAIRTPSESLLWPKVLAACTLTVRWSVVQTPWTMGTSDPVTLKIPTARAGEIIRRGAKHYLLAGLPGHESDAQAALEGWNDFLVQEAAHYGRNVPGLQDRNTQPRQSA